MDRRPIFLDTYNLENQYRTVDQWTEQRGWYYSLIDANTGATIGAVVGVYLTAQTAGLAGAAGVAAATTYVGGQAGNLLEYALSDSGWSEVAGTRVNTITTTLIGSRSVFASSVITGYQYE